MGIGVDRGVEVHFARRARTAWIGTFFVCVLCSYFPCAVSTRAQEAPAEEVRSDRRPVLITVDDLPIAGGLHREPEERARITDAMLEVLARHNIRAVGLVTWGNVNGPADIALLKKWLAAGHELGNHSHRHLSYTDTDVETYLTDIEHARGKIADLLSEHQQTLRFFRFPMLREGSTTAKLDAMREYLRESGQRNLPVTLDNQDWSFERPWARAVAAGDEQAIEQVAEAYHESLHLSIRHHERTGDQIFERAVPQILLLHAGSVGAAQWDRLFKWLADRGYRFADADEVLADPAFAEPHAYVGRRGPGLWDRILTQRRHQQARQEIETLIERQVGAWNRGDLEGFCADYTEDTIFISPSGRSQGREQVLERYRKRYPDRSAQGTLSIDVLDFKGHDGTEVSMLGDARPSRIHSVSVVGRWTLEHPDDTSRETATGLTLLVFERTQDGSWKIVRDASM